MSIQLDDMAKPTGDATEYNLTFFDGTTRTVYDTGVERPYPDGRLIVSRTDLNGVLTHVNDAFVEISGYTEDELIGKPQRTSYAILTCQKQRMLICGRPSKRAKNGMATSKTYAKMAHTTGYMPLSCQTYVVVRLWVIPPYAVSPAVARLKRRQLNTLP